MTSIFPLVPLSELAEDVSYGFTASATEEEIGPKFLRITDIVPRRISWGGVPHCAIDPADQDRFRLRDGDIVIARTGATVGYAKQLKNPPEAVFASYLVRIRIREGHDQSYVGLVIDSHDYREFVRSNSGGAAQPSASAKVLASFAVPLPPLENQRKIAAAVGAYDELIENNSRRIEILEEMAQAIYREWFVEFRYPGHEDVPLVDSELGRIPEGWDALPLREMVELCYGKALKSNDRHGGDVPVIGSGGVVGWHDVSLVEGPGVIVGRKGNVGSVLWSDQPFFPIDTTYFVRTDLPMSYVYYLLRGAEFINSHAAVPGLSREQAYGLIGLRPTPEVTEAFSSVMDGLFSLKRVLSASNVNLRETRDLLLPKLISGEIDVSDLDIELVDSVA